MTERTSLDAILDDAPTHTPAAPEPAAPAAPEPKAAPAAAAPAPTAPEATGAQGEPARGPDGKFVAKAPDAPATAPAPSQPPAQPELTDKEKAFLKAAHDERAKRQALEAELAKLRQGAPAQPPAQPLGEKKAFWDDPEGHLKAHEERMQQRETNLLLNTTERLARARYQDFDEKVAEFAELVKVTPGLGQQWLASPDPAEFAYSTGKNHLMLKQAGSLDALTEKVRKETEAKVRAQVEAEFKEKQEALARERAALPPSLSDVRGAPANGAKPVWAGPTSLDSILGK